MNCLVNFTFEMSSRPRRNLPRLNYQKLNFLGRSNTTFEIIFQNNVMDLDLNRSITDDY